MGAGKSTLGPELAARLGRPFVSVDSIVEERTGESVAEHFAERGESAFRQLEEQIATEVLDRRLPAVVELGGGAVGSSETREALERNAFTLLLETTPEEAWQRVAGSGRPLARDRHAFHALYDERRALYDRVADGRATDADGAVLAAAGVHIEDGALARLAELVPGDGPVEVVADATVARLHGEVVRAGLADRLVGEHEVPAGERAKTAGEAERLWSTIRLDRGGTLVALGGGSTLDLAGFVAATYLRGIAWTPIPTTLVAQVDAAIGGKTAIDVPAGKNLVGAFHWPARVLTDTATLATLPPRRSRTGSPRSSRRACWLESRLWELETGRAGAAVRRVQGRRSVSATRSTAPSEHSSTSGTRSRTRSSPLPATRSRTVARSPSGCSPLCVSRACTTRRRPYRRCSSRHRWPSTATWRGPPSAATRRREREARALCSSTLPGVRGGVSRSTRAMCGPLSTPSSRKVAAMRIVVLNGVNLDALDRRDPELYGGLTLSELETRIYTWASEVGCTVRCRQTNHEGEYVDWCHDALDWADGIVVNPGAWAHYSWAIRDAVELFSVPLVEVHLSNIDEREEWRRFSVLEGLVVCEDRGEGARGLPGGARVSRPGRGE